MEYEISEDPQLGEDQTYELYEVEHRRLARHAAPSPRTEQRDRAVAIPEQESGS